MTTFHIKPDFRTEFEASQKEITAAYKKAGVAYRVVVQTMFGDLMEYTSIAPIANFAESDGRPARRDARTARYQHPKPR